MKFLSEKRLTNWLTWGMYALPVTLFLYLQQTISPFITIKVFAFEIVAALLFGVWLLLIAQYPQYRPTRNRMSLAAMVFIGLLIISAFFGFNLSRSLWSSSDRAIGVIALLHFAVLTVILAAKKPIINWRRYITYLFWISVGMSLLAILQRFDPTLFFVADGGRPGGSLGNPQYLTGYLITNFFLGLWIITRQIKEWAMRVYYLFGEAILVIAFVLTNTRGAVVGLLLGLLAILVYYAWCGLRPFHPRTSLYTNWALLTLAGLIAVGGVFLATRNNPFWQKVPVFDRLAQTSLADASTNNRLIIWKIAGEAIKERPILGWGWDNFRYPFNKHFNPALFATGSSETYWDKPHNVFLEIGVSAGIVGLLAYLYLLYLLARRLGSADKFGVYGVALVAAYVAQNMVSFDTFGSFLMLFVLLGIAMYDNEAVITVPVARNGMSASIITALVTGVVVIGASTTVCVQILRANRANYNGMNYLSQVNSSPSFVATGINYFQDALAINQPYQNEIRESYISTLKQLSLQIQSPDLVKAVQTAIAEMQKALASDPDNFYYYYALADAKNVFFRFDKSLIAGAIEDIKKSDELSPHRQQNYYVLSRTSLLLGDMPGAVEAMRKAVELYPAAAEPHFYYALLLMDTEKYDEGVKHLIEAGRLGRYPKTGAEARAVNTYLERSKRFIDEINYFSDALDYAQLTDETQLEFLLQLGKAYYGANSYANARMVFEDVLKLAGNFRNNPRFANEFAKIFTAIGL
jgi:O-antigen ligase/tetratricopeptide (TPR) repeat protein